MVAGACSPVDLMYVTPKPAVASSFMAGNHSIPEHKYHGKKKPSKQWSHGIFLLGQRVGGGRGLSTQLDGPH